MNLFLYALSLARRSYYVAALNNLVSRDPLHPDVSHLTLRADAACREHDNG